MKKNRELLLKSGTRMSLFPIIFEIVLKKVAITIREEKIDTNRKEVKHYYM